MWSKLSPSGMSSQSVSASVFLTVNPHFSQNPLQTAIKPVQQAIGPGLFKPYGKVFNMRIKISIGNLSIEAELNDTPTAQKVGAALPLKCSFSTWGDEIYFTIPVTAPLDSSAKEIVELGELGYWPTGKAFCIFFGPTPMSSQGNIVPASAVNILGKILGDPKKFKEVMNEREVSLERVE
jgi:uncharacterized protein